jgi:hypothetical protein
MREKKMATTKMWAVVRIKDGKIVDGPDQDKQHVWYGWSGDERYRIARVEIREVSK